jgi:diguanylate cyclase (GGDEF)-like protein/PAS domain S-box-containing protein
MQWGLAYSTSFPGQTAFPNLQFSLIYPAFFPKSYKEPYWRLIVLDHYDFAAPDAGNGLWDWDLTTSRIHFSPEWVYLLGCAGTDLANTVDEWFNRIHPEDLESVRTEISSYLAQGSERFEIRHRMIHKDGCYRWMACQGVITRDQTGRAIRIMGCHIDMTAEKVVDPLTGLPNRILAVDRLTRSIEKAGNRSDFIFAVLILDLDIFESGIDCLETINADSLIIAAARRLETSLRNQCSLPGGDRAYLAARSEGREFIILLDGLGTLGEAKRIADQLLKEMLVSFEFSGREVFLRPSIGIALSATGYRSAEEALRDADTAVYRAKSFGKSRCEVFDTAVLESTQSREKLEEDLREALNRNQFVVHYQPILCLSTSRIVGFEALVRWNHPSRGLIPPMDFIPAAERNGFIVPMGQWILQQVCRQLKAWRQDSRVSKELWISINLSGAQFAHPSLAKEIQATLLDVGLDANGLMLELTEGTVMRNQEAARSTLMQLRVLGARVGLDDFGTGYSSLAHLRRFPLDYLKIDFAFIKSIETSKDSLEIIRTIIVLARQLGLRVIAEGIENPGQLELLRSLQCDYGQGFLFSRAIESGTATSLLLNGPASVEVEASNASPEDDSIPRVFKWRWFALRKMVLLLCGAGILLGLGLAFRMNRLPARATPTVSPTLKAQTEKIAEPAELPLKDKEIPVPAPQKKIAVKPAIGISKPRAPAAIPTSPQLTVAEKNTREEPAKTIGEIKETSPSAICEFRAVHGHVLGSCTGILKFDRDSVSFVSEKGKDSFYLKNQEYSYLLDRDWLVIKAGSAVFRFKSAAARDKTENRSQLSDLYQTITNLHQGSSAK